MLRADNDACIAGQLASLQKDLGSERQAKREAEATCTSMSHDRQRLQRARDELASNLLVSCFIHTLPSTLCTGLLSWCSFLLLHHDGFPVVHASGIKMRTSTVVMNYLSLLSLTCQLPLDRSLSSVPQSWKMIWRELKKGLLRQKHNYDSCRTGGRIGILKPLMARQQVGFLAVTRHAITLTPASFSRPQPNYVCSAPNAGEVSGAHGQSDQGPAEQPSRIHDQAALSSQVCTMLTCAMEHGNLVVYFEVYQG